MRAGLAVLLVAVCIGVSSTVSLGAYVEAQLGTAAKQVYLRAGQVDFAYEFATHTLTEGEPAGSHGLNVFVKTADGTTLFRNGINGITGWSHATFYNPFDGYVTIYGQGYGVLTSHGSFDVFVLDAETSLVGGDLPPTSPPTATPTPRPSSRTGVPSKPLQVHAMIISGADRPAAALQGKLHLTGGLATLGMGNTKPTPWPAGVTITPDPELLRGLKVPPVTPNLIDVRIVSFGIQETVGK